LIGGMIGAALVKAGPKALLMPGISKVILFIFLAPLMGLALGLFYGIIVHVIFRKFTPHKIDQFFRKGQLFSTAVYCMGHGGNDAQKTMGIIASLLFSAGLLGDKFYIPHWVVAACYTTISLGIMCGGWRIV